MSKVQAIKKGTKAFRELFFKNRQKAKKEGRKTFSVGSFKNIPVTRSKARKKDLTGLTEAQKEQLKKNREKALATRRAKAQEKKELKELQEKKKQKEKQQLKDFVNDVPPEPKIIEKHTTTMMPSMSEEEIEARTQKAIKKALEEHEEQRQIRKAKKKADQQKLKTEKEIHNMCVNASLYSKPASNYGDSDFFDVCWN